MITVAILINGQPIMARSAVNTTRRAPGGKTLYRVDDGSLVEHDPEAGAVALAKMLLDTIRESRAAVAAGEGR